MKISDFTMNTYRPYLKYNTVTAYTNKYFLPLGFTYKRYIEYDKFKNLNKLQKDMTLLKSCVVEGDIKDLHDFESFNIDTLKAADASGCASQSPPRAWPCPGRRCSGRVRRRSRAA